jgi:hypothetical protein
VKAAQYRTLGSGGVMAKLIWMNNYSNKGILERICLMEPRCVGSKASEVMLNETAKMGDDGGWRNKAVEMLNERPV